MWYFLYSPRPAPVQFPNGKRFAFSIVDDTDLTTLKRVEPVYEILKKHGLRTTKTVWVLDSNGSTRSPDQGVTLQDEAYREFVLNLKREGFEIALHGVRGGGSRRPDIQRGLEEFKATLGDYPKMHINHSQNRENLYWGRHIFTLWPFEWAAPIAMGDFFGDNKDSEYFWGDLAQKRVKYVRRFSFMQINLLAVNPSFPYHLAEKPYVNYWFPTSDGANVERFNELLETASIDKLEREGGVCLVYAHLGAGSFSRDGRVDARFEARIKELASRNGWFAPASEILDHLTKQPGWRANLEFRERVRLEARYVLGQLLIGRD
jgi:hypothetical protein